MSWVDGITSARVFRAVGVYFFLYCVSAATWRLYSAVACPPEEFIFGVNQDLVLGFSMLPDGAMHLYWWWQFGNREEAATS